MQKPLIGDILAQLPALCASDRNIIKQRLIAIETLELARVNPSEMGVSVGSEKHAQNGGFSTPQNTAKTLENNDILRAICDFMTFQGLECPYFGALMKTPQYKAFSTKAPAIAQYFAGLTHLERLALLHIGIGLLYDNLTEMKVVVTARTLMSHIHRLPGCINRAFPGYAKAGYLKLIVRKRDVRQKRSHQPVPTT